MQCLDQLLSVRDIGFPLSYYHFASFPFGLSIAPKMLKVVIDEMLAKANLTKGIVYVDDAVLAFAVENLD